MSKKNKQQKSAKRAAKRRKNETPEESLARRRAKAEQHLQRVARQEGIDLDQMTPEQYQERLTKITNKLTGMGLIK